MNITSPVAAADLPMQAPAIDAAPTAAAQADTTPSASGKDADKPEEQGRITVSHGGRILSKSDSGKDPATQAIEDSKYPEEIKKLMIKIRELQAQLREKAAELRDAAGDQTTPPRQREMKITAIREAVTTITSAIRSTTTTLNDAMTVMRMSSDDRKQIATMISGA